MDGNRNGYIAGVGRARTALGYRLYRSPRYYDGRKSMIVRTAEEARAWRAQLDKTLPAAPDYEEWGAEVHKVRVDERGWIKVK